MVILGNHRDAWVFGAVDPNSGTAVLQEMARAFGTLRTKGWRPGRSIVLCSWDAEEYGLIGSTEWVEVGGREACIYSLRYNLCTQMYTHIHTHTHTHTHAHTGEAEGDWAQYCGLSQCGHCCGRYLIHDVLRHPNSHHFLQDQHFYLLEQILCCTKLFFLQQSWYVLMFAGYIVFELIPTY